MVVGIVIFIILLVLLLILCYVPDKMYESNKEQAQRSGTAYKALETLNQHYQFKKFQGTLSYSKRTTAQKYRNRDYAYDIFVKEVILPDLDSFEELIEIAQYNASLYPSYLSQFSNIIPYASTKAEKDLCDEKKLKPCIDPKFRIELYYTFYYETRSNTFEFSIEEISRAIEQSKKINATKTAAQFERAQMSDRIRFMVLKRDGYTCQLCGRTAKDGVELEVDHIVPISKGGKTEMSNLQTLCKRCNRGKGNLLINSNEII